LHRLYYISLDYRGRHRRALHNLDGIHTKFGGDGPLSPASSRKVISRGLTKLALSAGAQAPNFPSNILMMSVWNSLYNRGRGTLKTRNRLPGDLPSGDCVEHFVLFGRRSCMRATKARVMKKEDSRPCPRTGERQLHRPD